VASSFLQMEQAIALKKVQNTKQTSLEGWTMKK